jgi:truncated hemoglobin YjbI
VSPERTSPEPFAKQQSIYERVGGDFWFVELIDRFYDLVDKDPVLRPLSGPESGTRGSATWKLLFNSAG